MADYSLLVSARGYVKASLTRLFNYITSDAITKADKSILIAKRERLITSFKEYEEFNMKILATEEGVKDVEDVGEQEEKYFQMMAKLNNAIAACDIMQGNEKSKRQDSHPLAQIKLPNIEISTFTGKYCEYTQFINIFKSVIHNNPNLDNAQRLYYLRNFLKNEPFDLVKNLPLSGESYTEALTILSDRYENNTLIMNDHITQLIDLPTIKPSASHIREFISQIRQHIAALKHLNSNVSSWDPILLCILLRKIDTFTAKAFQMERDVKKEPTLLEFLEFMQKRALALETVDGNGHHQHQSSAPGSSARTPTTKPPLSASPCAAQPPPCLYCKYSGKGSHRLFSCPKFKLIPVKERINFVNQNKLCKVCLNAHQGRCRFFFKCHTCKKAHSTLLHDESDTNANVPEQGAPVVLIAKNKHNQTLLPTAQVKLMRSDGTELHIKALLDTGSQVSFVTSQVVHELGLQPKESNIDIVGITNVNNKIKYSIPLEVHSLTSQFRVTVNCSVVEKITCKLPQQQFKKITLPPGIRLADESYNNPSDIDMLMGCDVFFQILLPNQELQTANGGAAAASPAPCIISTQFGAILGGTLSSTQVSHSHSQEQVSLLCTSCDESISKTIKQFWQTEDVPQIFNEASTEAELCEESFKSSVILNNQQFQVDLPLKVPLEQVNDHLGDSFNLALSRFVNLEKKLHKNEELFQQYKQFIDQIIELGHGRYIDIAQYDFKNDPIYFLPHHGVINEKSKSTKLRVVFDGSMLTNKKVSLNDILLNGSVVQNDLFEILLLFRLGSHMFTTDVKKMFRCVTLNPSHASLQNILWREDPNQEIKCIQLTTVTYGLKSSSFLATRCLYELADMHERELPLASFILKNCTYVDDVLYANFDLNTTIEAKNQLTKLLERGSFLTHKWASNVPLILQDIPENEQQFDNIDFEKENFNLKTLGINYNVKDDCFVITCPTKFGDRTITKREVLSYISKFYDPPGFVAPIIITAKSFIQTLWAANIGWDSPLTGDLREEWLLFVKSLDSMAPIALQRNINTSHALSTQLIGFADASSTTAYGCCIYLRVILEGKARLYLLCSKSRVNPLSKPLTVPRLELNATLLLARLMVKVHKAISTKITVDNTYLFTDSKIVLAWIGTQITQLNAYVANRVQVVAQLTAGWTWHYVSTHDNPADCITRGVPPQELAGYTLWWDGPTFLRDHEYRFDEKVDLHVNTLPEMKVSSKVQKTTLSSAIALSAALDSRDLFDRYSNIQKMTRIFAYIWRFYNNCKTKDNSKRIKNNFLTSNEIKNSLLFIIKHEQNKYYSKDINSLKNNTTLNDNSLKNLHPFLDESGMLRVGGRLHNSALPFTQRHPLILPKQSRITDMIIHDEHLRLLHAGPKLLLSVLNERYWLINGLRHVKKIVYKCNVCFRLKAEASKQLMGSLPTDRVTQALPFDRVGIDYAGPFNIKQSRIRRPVISKGYICLFVCFTTKAVHLEVVSDMTTASFLACFRRFVSRRGLPHDVYCDNASNFKGARNQLTDLYRLVNSQSHQTQVNHYAVQNNIRFHFIPSYSPVFGGLWEAAVKSTKHHLKRTVQNNVLTYEEMCTVLAQIEAILNSRPLVPLSNDSDDFSYLTPGHFLTGRSLVSYPEHDLTNVPISRLRLWNITNKIVQSFWKTWNKYYLNNLQSRPKWRDECHNVKVGDLVLLRDDNTPPLTWPMGRITKVFPGKDDKVRAFEVMTSNRHKHIRSITKVCLFPINDSDKGSHSS